jgi:hypothetical protein
MHQNGVFHAILYVVVPVIMLSMLGLGVFVTMRVPRSFKLSALAGFAAGLVIFAIYFVSEFSNFRSPSLGLNAVPTFKPVPIIAGAAIGFGLLLLARFLEVARAGLVGLFIMFLVATSSTAVFSYFFNSPLRADTVFLALGCLGGLLVYVVLFSDSVRTTLRSTI